MSPQLAFTRLRLPWPFLFMALLAPVHSDEPTTPNIPIHPRIEDAYTTFEADNGITGAGADADSDGDGIPNGIEFVIGGDPSGPDSDSNHLLPTIVDTDPLYVDFIFRRTDDSAASDPFVQYGSNLTGWTNAEPGVPTETPVVIDETNDHFGTGIDQVTVRIPRVLADGQKLFMRLRVNIP